MSNESKPESPYSAVRIWPESLDLLEKLCVAIPCPGQRGGEWTYVALIHKLVVEETKRRGLPTETNDVDP